MSVTEASASPWLRMYEDRATSAVVASALVEGTVPAGLRGTHYRVGPASGESFGHQLANPFADANGYVGAYTFTDEGVRFRGDVVKTPAYQREQEAGRMLTSTFSTVPDRSTLINMLTGIRGMLSYAPGFGGGNNPAPVKDAPNHVPCLIGGRLVLIGGAGAPFALSASDLSVIGPETFGGALPKQQIYLLGESHLDPGNGDRCFLEICTFPAGVRLWSVDPGGRGRGSRVIKLPHIYLPHDFGLTATKIVLPAGPVYANFPAVLKATLGLGSMNDAFVWHPDEPTRYYVVDRRTWHVHSYIAPTYYPVHVANAFDDGDDVVLDINIHSSDAAIRGFTAGLGYQWGEPGFTNRLNRVRLSADGEYSARELVPFDCEVPLVSETTEGRANRYVYAGATARGIAGANRIVKADTETGEVSVHDYPSGCVVTEPVFVPDPASANEDGGWILCQVYDGHADRTFLSVVDSARFDRELARIRLPLALPYLLHGKFAAA
jgi:all-trans-8'-apo-beta-carotenal 15,15'-oxygenase